MTENPNPNPQDEQSDGVTVSNRLFTALIVGFMLVFVGVIILVAAMALSGGSGSVGGVVFIGPIPIVFGAGPDSNWLITISIILAVVTLALFVIYSRRAKRVVG
jgi:uncharacterized membrane protein